MTTGLKRDALRKEIDGGEQQLKDSLNELKASVSEKTQIMPKVDRSPYKWLSIAAGVGFFAACLQAGSPLPDNSSANPFN